MSRTGIHTAEFGGETRDFCLRWGELMELQERRDAGPDWLLAKLASLQYRLEDVTEIIRLGLIGGGMDAAQASRLVRLHVEQKPFDIGGPEGMAMLAVRILSTSTRGSEDEPPGKPEGEMKNGSTISPTEKSASDPSSAMLS